ncbi:MAG: hypothetical protein QNL12_14475, partial [Acidimicrobiia bacterium]|nr:hypothetical protein [Acidimicrobiia bacterium]MDX2468521.1 hypothetical protein [Acidimicrobiia bacterium]
MGTPKELEEFPPTPAASQLRCFPPTGGTDALPAVPRSPALGTPKERAAFPPTPGYAGGAFPPKGGLMHSQEFP